MAHYVTTKGTLDNLSLVVDCETVTADSGAQLTHDVRLVLPVEREGELLGDASVLEEREGVLLVDASVLEEREGELLVDASVLEEREGELLEDASVLEEREGELLVDASVLEEAVGRVAGSTEREGVVKPADVQEAHRLVWVPALSPLQSEWTKQKCLTVPASPSSWRPLCYANRTNTVCSRKA